MSTLSDQKLIELHGFTPKELVQVKSGKYTFHLYPRVETSMPSHERAHAFHVNYNTLTQQHVDKRTMIDVFGNQLNIVATVTGCRAEFMRHFDVNAWNFQNLEIISFHNSAGTAIPDATVDGDPQVLKDVGAGVADADRRPADVRYVLLKCTLNFQPLMEGMTDQPSINPVLRVQYYAELPQTTEDALDDMGAIFPLTTYQGPADLRMLSVDQFTADILNVVHQDGPVWLRPALYNPAVAEPFSEEAYGHFEKQILTIALPCIVDRAFKQLCPSYHRNPDHVIKNLKQTFVDANGATVTQPVHEFHMRFMNGLAAFAPKPSWPCDACRIFIDALDERILANFKDLYPEHSTDHAKDAHTQLIKLQDILAKAVIAEEKVRSSQKIVASMLSGSQALQICAQAYPSHAERTLNMHDASGSRTSNDSSSRRRPPKCFGCGGAHPYKAKGKDGKIICPHANDPSIRANAERNFAAFKEKRKSDAKKRARKKKGEPDWSDLSEAGRKKIIEQLHAVDADNMSVASSLTNPTVGSRGRGAGVTRPTGNGNPLTFVIDAVQILNVRGLELKPPLSVPITPLFPHIQLPLGNGTEDEGRCPVIRGIVDTAAALTTGSWYFISAIAKHFPHCVEEIQTEKTRQKITLSGVVQQGGAALTTDLPIAVKFKLPFFTKDGSPTSLMVACGKDVSSNCIFGLPFLQAAGAVTDLVNGCVEFTNLDAEPFPIEFARSMVSVPNVSRVDVGCNYTNYNDVLTEVANIDASVANACAVDSAPTKPSSKKLRWGHQQANGAAAEADGTNASAAISLDGSMPAMGGPDALDDYRDQSMDTDADMDSDE